MIVSYLMTYSNNPLMVTNILCPNEFGLGEENMQLLNKTDWWKVQLGKYMK